MTRKMGHKHSAEHKAAISEGMKKHWAAKNPIRINDLPPPLRYYVRKLYKNGFRGEAIRAALEGSKA